MNSTSNGLTDTTLDQKRLELVALSRQLRAEHSQLRETFILLRGESKELSEESKLLRTNGYSLKEVVDQLRFTFCFASQRRGEDLIA